MTSKITYGNDVLFNQTKCAEKLSMTKATVCNALKSLETLGVIKKSETTEGNIHYYKINPVLVYKGKNENYQDCCDSFLGVSVD